MSRTATRDEFEAFRGAFRRMVVRVWEQHQGDFSPSRCWTPAVNIYRSSQGLELCVDLAGVDRRTIDLTIEPGRLTIRGYRAAPEPYPGQEVKTLQILAMEIDHGAFSREIALPDDVDTPHVTSEYRDGLLWVRLPLRRQA